MVRLPKLEFTRPKSADVLILDNYSETTLLPLLGGVDFETLDTRGSEISLRPMVRAMLTRRFWQGERQLAYAHAFAKSVQPKLMVTVIDNNKAFIDLYDESPHIKSVLIQNGLRNNLAHLISTARHSIDLYFTFNEAYASLAAPYISGQTVALGSIRNNFMPLSESGLSNARRVIFISQYIAQSEAFQHISQDGTKHSWDEFFEQERLVLPILAQWCSQAGLTLEIKSRYSYELLAETDFYTSLVAPNKLRIFHSKSERETYELLDSGAMFVTIDSTLGYEALSRGARVAFISGRDETLGADNRAFGWPNVLEDQGVCWLNKFSEAGLISLLDRVASGERSNNESFQKFSVMEFDQGNTTLARVLSEYT